MFVQSQVSPQELKLAYQSLRQAALGQENTPRLKVAGLPVDVVSSQIDQDPKTPDTIVATTLWDGGMSSTQATLTFRESRRAGKQILEFSAEQPRSLFGGGFDRSKARIDLSNGELLSASGTGNFQIAQTTATALEASPQEMLFASIRGKYQDIQRHVAAGEKEFSQGVGKVTVKDSGTGYVQVESWDGGFSSSASTETFRQYSGEAGEMLE